MGLARQELGEDALLVNARPATPETRYLGAYEVVFGVPPKTTAAPALASATSKLSQDRLAEEVAGLKREFERMMQAFLESQERGGARIPETISALQACPTDSTLGRPGAARTIVALVGPPGVGKTTTLVKLAARYGLTSRKPAQILSTDVYRIAAADQLRSLAAILGIGCEIAETAGALAQLLEEHRSKELIFIDTPGLARAEMEDASDLAALIASHPEIDAHLVLPAFMRPADMTRIIEQYAVFGPRKLLFTRMDETLSYHDLIQEAARHSLPVSFFGIGQQIPDDLEAADPAAIDSLLRSQRLAPAQTKGAAA